MGLAFSSIEYANLGGKPVGVSKIIDLIYKKLYYYTISSRFFFKIQFYA